MSLNFPAILIGGPPHSGKSVLVYSITQALRDRKISHYALRACPDGEGDWSNEIPQPMVRNLRVKGCFSDEFTQTVIRFLEKRHLPLLVDVGGRPNEAQQRIFSHCTHAILVVGERENDPTAYKNDLSSWREMMIQQGVPIIAEIQSTLNGQNEILASTSELLIGRQQGLERGSFASGVTFDVLVEQIATHITFDEQRLAAEHQQLCPPGTEFIDLPKLAAQLGNGDRFWQPEELSLILAHIQPDKPLAAYGRSAIWSYVALSLHIYPAQFYSFDAKLGWVMPPALQERETQREKDDWNIKLVHHEIYSELKMNATSQYLDIAEPDKIPLLSIPNDKGLMLSGRLPIWLYCAVARHYAEQAAWIACYQPFLNGGVVVYSTTPDVAVGDVISH